MSRCCAVVSLVTTPGVPCGIERDLSRYPSSKLKTKRPRCPATHRSMKLDTALAGPRCLVRVRDGVARSDRARRVPLRDSVAPKPQLSLTMPCFFLPDDTLTLPSAKSPSVITRPSSATFSSLMRAPPPLMSRRTSDLDFANSSLRKRSTTGTPSPSSAAGSSTVGSVASSEVPPPSALKSCLAVSLMGLRHSCPWSMRVVSSASTSFASLMACPLSFASSSMRSSGSSVKRRRNRITSASAVLRQYCQ
mmetsp:Transcript_22360/g.60439  ORF Transcript_22360/g.60439 Transcript_22360/m.60439 type:complete len:249 (-) Transcript_22360:128-874(-)